MILEPFVTIRGIFILAKKKSQDNNKRVSESRKTPREIWREKYLEYLSDPENEIVRNGKVLTRGQIAKALETTRQTLYRHFTAQEMDAMDADALAERRRRCSRHSNAVDFGLFRRARSGDAKAAKLYYERIEGWTPSKRIAVEPALDEIRQMAIDKGFDPDEYVALYLAKKRELIGGTK